ncbi:UDP-galactofuranosyl transferase GlfT1, partial [Mycobacterium tuberculosis variant bovis Bz 31150]
MTESVFAVVAGQPIATTYLGSRRNLGGAGGFALGMLHALAQGADWVWLADDDGHAQDARGTTDRHHVFGVTPKPGRCRRFRAGHAARAG